MEIYLKANGQKIRPMVMVFTFIVMEQSTRATGRTTSRMDKE